MAVVILKILNNLKGNYIYYQLNYIIEVQKHL